MSMNTKIDFQFMLASQIIIIIIIIIIINGGEDFIDNKKQYHMAYKVSALNPLKH